MRPQVFQQLETKFRKSARIKSVFKIDQVEDVMEAAGRALYACTCEAPSPQRQELADWFAELPRARWREFDPVGNQHTQEGEYWATYWWHAVLWIWKHHHDTGIVPGRSRIVKLKHPSIWRDFSTEVLSDLYDRPLSDKAELRLWRSVAGTSADACRFLADFFSHDSVQRKPAYAESSGTTATPADKESVGLGPGDWLMPPLSLADLANRLDNITAEKAKQMLQPFGLKHFPPNNRQSWTVDLAKMPGGMRQKLKQR